MTKKSTYSKPLTECMTTKARGGTSANGTEYIQIRLRGKTSTWLPRSAFRGNAKQATDLLAAQGIVALKHQEKALLEAVAHVVEFPERVIASRSGWVGDHFALPSGMIIGPPNAHQSGAAFPLTNCRDGVSGTLPEWTAGVAEPLVGQRLPIFALMASFAPLLLKLVEHPTNFVFVLQGRGEIGKSTACQLAASTIGPMETAIVSMNATANALDGLMASFNDMPLILEEANMHLLQAESNSGRAAADLALRLGGGIGKLRHNGKTVQAREGARFVGLSSSNRAQSDVFFGLDQPRAQAAADRMIEIGIPNCREHGVFDSCPAGYESVAQFASSLVLEAREQYGTAFRAVVDCLTNDLVTDREKVLRRIEVRRRRFIRRVSARGLNPSQRRVADAFSLVFAAGMMARSYGALPRAFNCMAAAVYAYDLHLGSRRALVTPSELLLEVMAKGNLVSLEDWLGMPPEEKATVDGMVDEKHYPHPKDTERELLMTRQQLLKITNSPTRFAKDPEVRRALVRDGNHNTVKRTAAGEARQRFFAFRVAVLEEALQS